MLQNIIVLHRLVFDAINQYGNITPYYTHIYISTALHLHKT